MPQNNEVFLMVTDGMTQRAIKDTDDLRDFRTGSAFNTAMKTVRPTALAVVSKLISVGPVAGKSVNSVAAAFAGNQASNTITLQAVPSPVSPRNLRVIKAASYDGGIVTVTGTDQFGTVISEDFAGDANATAVGSKIFATITGAVKAAVGTNAATATIGTGDTIGTGVVLANSVAFLWVAATPEVVVASSTYNSFIPTTTPSATTFILMVNV